MAKQHGRGESMAIWQTEKSGITVELNQWQCGKVRNQCVSSVQSLAKCLSGKQVCIECILCVISVYSV